MDDDALKIERFKRGERGAFDELVEKYRKEIFYLALRMLKNHEDAEDMSQQAFVNAYNAISGFKGDAAFRTWLYRIAINLCNSKLRGADTKVELRDDLAAAPAGGENSPLDSLIKNEDAREAISALDELGEKQKMSVMLRIYQELPYAEIGKIMGCTEDTAKVNFHYGMENLRKKMKSREV